jgi:hypothetical protein
MAWIAVDLSFDGNAYLHERKPSRNTVNNSWIDGGSISNVSQNLIYMLVGKKMTWLDEPVEIVKREKNERF